MIFQPPPLGEQELAVLGDIAQLRDALKTSLFEPQRWKGSLRRLSFARNVQGSNSIEGYVADLNDAAAVIDDEAPTSVDDETRRALEGYRNAMTYVLQLCDESDDFGYTPQLLKALHFMMTSYDLKNRPGKWRAGDIYVRSDAREVIVYEGPSVDLVPALVDELVDTLNTPSGQAVVDAAMAHLNLVMIHPFRDGNGRMARCLQSLVLGRDGVLSPVFMSVEEYLGRNTTAYYDTLAAVGGGKWAPDRSSAQWVRFMLTAHLRQARTQRQRVKDYSRLWVDLVGFLGGNDDSRFLPALLDAAIGLRITRRGYVALLAQDGVEVSEQSAGRDLKALTEIGWLLPSGEKRGRFYTAAPAIEGIWRRIRADRPERDDSDPFAA